MMNQLSKKSIKCIDLHTHLYLPEYIKILKQRQEIPKITNNNRLIILPNECQNGRPIGDEYSSLNVKYQFMENHGITQSVISLANPWGDFIDEYRLIQSLNDDLYNICKNSNDKLLGLGILPLGCKKQDILSEIQRLSKMKDQIKGIILSLNGQGQGLYDENFIDIYGELAKNDLFIFLHPHKGVGEYNQKFGHILPLAFGFTFETTQRVGELILSGMLDRFDNKLKILLSHAGGALAQLSGRLDSCYKHDHNLQYNLKRYELPSQYLQNCFFYDSICYNQQNLKMIIDFVGAEKMVFGTDHPFFPPVNQKDYNNVQWTSCLTNQQIINQTLNQNQIQQIMYKTAEDHLLK